MNPRDICYADFFDPPSDETREKAKKFGKADDEIAGSEDEMEEREHAGEGEEEFHEGDDDDDDDGDDDNEGEEESDSEEEEEEEKAEGAPENETDKSTHQKRELLVCAEE